MASSRQHLKNNTSNDKGQKNQDMIKVLLKGHSAGDYLTWYFADKWKSQTPDIRERN